jgi:branched-chain amino acid transport system ATP-binding protein
MAEPELIMLDEPLAGINPTLRRELLGYMQQLRDSTGRTFFFVEHDMSAVMSVSDHIWVMSNGRVIAEGAPMVVRQNQAVVDAYLGARRGPGPTLQELR